MNFKDLHIQESLVNALYAQGITEATSVQEEAFPIINKGANVLIHAETGSGKTLSYLLPLVSMRLSSIKAATEAGEKLEKGAYCIILAPTEELAVQITHNFRDLCAETPLAGSVALLNGSGNLKRQQEMMKNHPAFLAGTPGRIRQLIELRKIKVSAVKALVLDESEKLADVSFADDIKAIRKSLMKYTQVVCVSATKSKKEDGFIDELTFDQKFEVLNCSEGDRIPDTITHHYSLTSRRERFETLRSILNAVPKKFRTIVFVRSSYEREQITDRLRKRNYRISTLDGRMKKKERAQQMKMFDSGANNILITSDVAARGLQINNVYTVVNYDLPDDTKEYVHRAGRCGRNGHKGICVSLISPNELEKIAALERKYNITVTKVEPSGGVLFEVSKNKEKLH